MKTKLTKIIMSSLGRRLCVGVPGCCNPNMNKNYFPAHMSCPVLIARAAQPQRPATCLHRYLPKVWRFYLTCIASALVLSATYTSAGVVGDFNGDGHPDYVLFNPSTRRTAIWYLNNKAFIGAAYGPTLPAGGGWYVGAVADFNRDGHPDYALQLFNEDYHYTALWYLSGPTFIGGAYGPTPPANWVLRGSADFNGDNYPDVLYNLNTGQTAIWYLNNNVFVSGAYGPTLPAGWSLVGLADFNRDGKMDYLLFNAATRQSAIWYLNNNAYVSGAYGPTAPTGWQVQGAADFNGDAKPDYVLYNPSTRRTAIWYMNNNVYVGGAYGPTIASGWSLAGD
jgi:hypothetical protein